MRTWGVPCGWGVSVQTGWNLCSSRVCVAVSRALSLPSGNPVWSRKLSTFSQSARKQISVLLITLEAFSPLECPLGEGTHCW